MTHEELLAKIDAKKEPWYNEITEDFELSDMELINALRAVVELHSPFDNLAGEFCTVCTAMEDKDIYTLYPCPTIQAIEKELE